MRNLILFGPFFWFRKIVLWILILLLILLLVFYIVGNSSVAIKKAIDTFAPDYNISYESIKGNALSGFEIKKPTFNDAVIADTVVLKWNPNLLAAKKVHISKLHLQEANVGVIQSLVHSFSSDKNESEENATEALALSVDVNDINISLAPFIQNGVDISTAKLSSKNVTYKEGQVSINDINLVLESNVSNIYIKGKYENRIVRLSAVNLDEINLTAIQGLLGGDTNKTEDDNSSVEEKQEENPLMPKKVVIDNLEIHLLPYSYKPFDIQQIDVQINALHYDLSSAQVEDAIVDINATSNVTTLTYSGKIAYNHLLGNVVLQPKPALYKMYNIPLRKEAIHKIMVDLNASKDKIIAVVDTKAKKLLEAKAGAFNVDVTLFRSHVVYDIASSEVNVTTEASVNTPYAKDITIQNSLTYTDTLRHYGEIRVKNLKGIDDQYLPLLNNVHINYKGDSKGIDTNFSTNQLKGSFVTKDFKKAKAHIESKNILKLASIVTLPKELQDTVVQLSIDAPLNLQDFSKIDAQVKATSNLVNIDARVNYAKAITVDGTIAIPKDSLIKSYSADLKWEGLSPIKTLVRYEKNALQMKLNATSLYTNIGYNVKYGQLNGRVKLAGVAFNLKGNTKEKLKIKTKITSLERLSKDLNKIYDVGTLPAINGDIDATLVVDKLQSATLNVSAPKLLYKADKKTKYTIENVKLVTTMDADKIVLKSYQIMYDKQKYFSTKEAKITLGDTIYVSNFWLNDELLIEGDYKGKQQKGKFTAKAKRFHIQNKIVDIYTKIDSDITLNGKNTTIKGDILLLEGKITPQVSGRTFASDSDIIILQHIRKKKQSSFLDNLNLMLQIKTKKALSLRQKLVRIRLKPELTITKHSGSDMLFLGDVTLLKGSTYRLEDKKIILRKSHIYLTGNIHKPLLDIKAKYKSLNHLITIGVTGTPSRPRLDFSSTPTLSREQILSVLLFDTEAGGDTHSGIEMMKMMGGAMAKVALAEVGVKVDHLVFGEGNSIEVGKKLTQKVTVIYVNGEVPKVKLKYKHNRGTESVIGVSEESQSYDIIYKRDF